MGLDAVLRGAFAAANAATAGIQVAVSFEAWIGQDGVRVGGARRYAAPITLRALVQMDPAIEDGQEIKLLAIVTFLELPPVNPTAGREGPIDTRDRLTLPGGQTGPVSRVRNGMVDDTTGLPYALQVEMGH